MGPRNRQLWDQDPDLCVWLGAMELKAFEARRDTHRSLWRKDRISSTKAPRTTPPDRKRTRVRFT